MHYLEKNGFYLLREGGKHAIYTNKIKVIPVEKRKSRIIVIADIPEGEKGKEVERKKEQELAARIMKRLCEEAEARCELVEE